jgi:hypothetical protein
MLVGQFIGWPMLTSYDQQFLLALILTITVETIVLIALDYIFGNKNKLPDILFAGFLASFGTIPYLWYILPLFWGGYTLIFIGEGLVAIVEMVILKNILKIGWSKALIFSLIANMASFLIGLFVL